MPRAGGRPSPSTATALGSGIRRRLDRGIGRALRHEQGARSTLRAVVQLAVGDLLLAGASEEAIRSLLAEAVTDHPARGGHDRVSILTGESASAALTRAVLEWAAQVADAAAAPAR